jgi:N-acyl homoserine lactone hydrolase
MMWDTGFSPSSLGKYKSMGIEMNQTLLAQLKKIDVKPEQISIVGLSHWHFDHTGQAAYFTKARLLMGHIASTKWGKRRYLSMEALLNPAKQEAAA